MPDSELYLLNALVEYCSTLPFVIVPLETGRYRDDIVRVSNNSNDGKKTKNRSGHAKHRLCKVTSGSRENHVIQEMPRQPPHV